MAVIRPCGSALQCRATDGRWLSGSSRREWTAGGSDGVALVIWTLTVPTDKLHKTPRSLMTEGGVTPGAQCRNKTNLQVHVVPELQGRTPNSLAAGYCVVLTHSPGRPERIKMQLAARGWREVNVSVLQLPLDSQTAVRFRWQQFKGLREPPFF